MTTKTRSLRPSPAMIIACLALLLALTGSAIAAGVAKNSVRSAQIANGTIRTVDIRDNAVNAPKIAPDAVGAEEIAAGAVASPEVADQSLTADDLGPDSVGASEIQANAVGTTELAGNSVGSGELQSGSVRAADLATIVQVSNSTAIKGGDNASVSVGCPAGTSVISGGSSAGFYQVHVAGSYRSGNGWHLDARSGAVGDTTITVFAYCLAG